MVSSQRRGRHEMRWSAQATMSREHDGALVATTATAKHNATLPRAERWCWWLEEVEVMAEQQWTRRIDYRRYVDGKRLRRSYDGDATSSELRFGKAEREGGSESG